MRKQKNVSQMKEKDKTPEKVLNNMVIRLLNDLSENFSRDRKYKK